MYSTTVKKKLSLSLNNYLAMSEEWSFSSTLFKLDNMVWPMLRPPLPQEQSV